MRLAHRMPDASDSARAMLERFSLEMTGRDVGSLEKAAQTGAIPPQTPINITYLATESHETRIAAARAAGAAGLVPVPHIAARRIADELNCGICSTI